MASDILLKHQHTEFLPDAPEGYSRLLVNELGQLIIADEDRNETVVGEGAGGAVTSVAGKTGAVTLVKADVGLANVDNTADANKPVSTAQSAAIAAAVAPKAPAAFTSRVLTNADDGTTLICASARVATVNTGLVSGFGCAFKGAVTFAGTATVTDVRTTGSATPWCSLVQTGANTYDAVGTKA